MESSQSSYHKTNHSQSIPVNCETNPPPRTPPHLQQSNPIQSYDAIWKDHRPQAPANQRRSAHGILGAAIARSPPLREARLSTLCLILDIRAILPRDSPGTCLLDNLAVACATLICPAISCRFASFAPPCIYRITNHSAALCAAHNTSSSWLARCALQPSCSTLLSLPLWAWLMQTATAIMV